MGYSMRFYDTAPQPLPISVIRSALRDVDPKFDVDEGSDWIGCGYLFYDGELYAELSIGEPNCECFDREASVLKPCGCEPVVGLGREKVEAVLRNAQRQLLVQVRWGGREPEITLSRLDILWDWLFAHRSGLLHVEGEGFYENELLIVAFK